MVGRRTWDALAVVGVVVILAGLVIFYRTPDKPKSRVLGTRYESPSPTPSAEPSAEPSATADPLAGLPFPSYIGDPGDGGPGEGKSAASNRKREARSRPRSRTAAARACRNSTDPRCGSFYWDPKPAPDQPLEIAVSWSPENPEVGEEVTFVVTVRDPDAEIRRTAVAYGDTSRTPRLSSCHKTRYGPWTPPARKPGFFQQTYVHTYDRPGSFNATIVSLSGGCDSPYGSLITQKVPVSVKAPPPTPGFVTLFFERSVIGPTDSADCQLIPGQPTIFDTAEWLRQEAIVGVGGVLTGSTAETTRTCDGTASYASWQDLGQLRAEGGMVFVSQGKTASGHRQADTTEELRAETCDTIGSFEQHGHYDAWGLFASPTSPRSSEYSVIDSCFGMIRRFSDQPTDRSTGVREPRFANAALVTGGACNDPNLSCYEAPEGSPRYRLPSDVTRFVSPGQNQYSIVEFFRFVSGGNQSGPVTWDCTSSDPRAHWTSRFDLYCFEDFQAAVSARPSSVVVTDPASVASAWGISPGGG